MVFFDPPTNSSCSRLEIRQFVTISFLGETWLLNQVYYGASLRAKWTWLDNDIVDLRVLLLSKGGRHGRFLFFLCFLL
jgi:hypothetical protein